jgi:hypothetical protein
MIIESRDHVIQKVSKCFSNLPRWFDSTTGHPINRVGTQRRIYARNPSTGKFNKLLSLEYNLQSSTQMAKQAYITGLLSTVQFDSSRL